MESITELRSHASNPTGVLIAVCVAVFFGVVSASGVAVVLPEIGAALDIADGDLTWVLSGFLLTYGVAIPFFGRLASRYGARRLFLFGVVMFTVGSVLAAFATGLATLLGARSIQAIGGAAVPGLGMTLASRAYPEQRRGIVLGVVSATMGVAAAAGPLLAGAVSELADWRWLFAVSALCIVSLPVGLRSIEADEEAGDEAIDLVGGALFGLSVAALLFLVTRSAQVGWTDGQVLLSAAASVGSIAAFIRHQRSAEKPFIPAALLANRRYRWLVAIGFLLTFANLAVQIGYPFLFSSLHAMSSLDIGLVLLPAALATALMGVVAGGVVDRRGPRAPVRLGLGLMIAGTAFTSVVVGSSAWSVAAIAVAFGLGFALVNTPLAAVVSLSVEPSELADALSLNTMMFFIGGSFGSSVFTSIAIADPEVAANPLHGDVGAGFSNAFLALTLPLAVAVALTRFVDRPEASPAVELDPCDERWTHDCQVPWSPAVDRRDLSEPLTTGAST